MTGLVGGLAGGLSELAGANGFKSLTLENFQSHVKTVVEFAGCGELTVIVGASDAGKTAILRGLRWLLFNVPQGDSFVRVGATMARVTLEMESGHRVVRERTRGGVNRYRIIEPGGGAPLTFEGFGNGVPLEVQELTGVKPVQIGDMELNLNIAEQLDGPFLGRSVSAGARAKVLGKLAGTEEIDFAGKELGTDLYRRNQDVKRLKGEIKELDNRIGLYGWLDGEVVRLRKLEQLVADVKVLQERRAKLAALDSRLVGVSASVKALQKVIVKYQGVELAEALVGEAGVSLARQGNLEQASDAVLTLNRVIGVCNETVAQWSGVELAAVFAAEAERLAERRKTADYFLHHMEFVQGAVDETQDTLERLAGMDEANRVAQNVRSLAERRQAVSKLQDRYIDISRNVGSLKTILARLAGVEQAESEHQDLLALVVKWNNAAALKNILADRSVFVDHARGQAVLWENRVAELQGAYQDELVRLGVCPVCGSVVDAKKAKEAC